MIARRRSDFSDRHSARTMLAERNVTAYRGMCLRLGQWREHAGPQTLSGLIVTRRRPGMKRTRGSLEPKWLARPCDP